MNIFQRAVAPQAQSLCFAEQWRQFQCSHQIHLRWFTSRTKSATIQRRISVCDTSPTVRLVARTGNGPGGPNRPLGGPSGYAASGFRTSTTSPCWVCEIPYVYTRDSVVESITCTS